MKKYSIILIAMSLLLVACNKEIKVADDSSAKTPTFIGYIDRGDDTDTKTAYDGEGKFSWVAGDVVAVQVEKSGTYDKWNFTADDDNASSTFTSSKNGSGQNYADLGWSLGPYAFYPKGKSGFDLSFTNSATPSVTMPNHSYDYYYLDAGDDFKGIPLIGEMVSGNGEDQVVYRFNTATGALKLNFSGMPSVNAQRITLEHPSYPLNGTFTLSAENTILASNYVSGSSIRMLEPSNGFSTAYVPLPIGTIPAGLIITAYRTTGDLYARIVTTSPIDIKKNTVTNMTQTICRMSSSVTVSGDLTDSPSVTVSISGSETVKYVVNSDEAAGFAALASAPSASAGTVDYSALSSGTYYVCYKVYGSDGHAYIKNSISFTKPLPKIALSESMFSTNSVHVGDGTGLAGLCDDNTTNGYHYHSNWGGDQHYDSTYGIWIDIDLGGANTADNFQLRYCTRANANNHVKHVKIYASDDKSTWGEPLADVSNALAGVDYTSGTWITPISFSTGSAKRYIRFSVVENSNGADLTKSSDWGSSEHYIHIAEMELYGD